MYLVVLTNRALCPCYCVVLGTFVGLQYYHKVFIWVFEWLMGGFWVFNCTSWLSFAASSAQWNVIAYILTYWMRWVQRKMFFSFGNVCKTSFLFFIKNKPFRDYSVIIFTENYFFFCTDWKISINVFIWCYRR